MPAVAGIVSREPVFFPVPVLFFLVNEEKNPGTLYSFTGAEYFYRCTHEK
jgi:hypothetical protein